MGFIKTIKLNIVYLKTLNGCVWSDYCDFIHRIIYMKGAFTKKRYIWNLIRGKTFYKGIENYIVKKARQLDTDSFPEETMGHIEWLIHQVITTEKEETARSSFVWGLIKDIPILTVDTIPYINPERIQNILMSDKTILNDDAISGFIDAVMELRKEVDSLTKTNEALNVIISDD